VAFHTIGMTIIAFGRISVAETAGKSKRDIGLEYVLESLIEIFHKTSEAVIGIGNLRFRIADFGLRIGGIAMLYQL
jgi:hypothetical protein